MLQNTYSRSGSCSSNSKKSLFTMLAFVLGLCAATTNGHSHLPSNYLNNAQTSFQPNFGKESAPFLIRHVSSGNYLHPLDGSLVPKDLMELVIDEGYHPGTWYTYIPVTDYPGFGLLKH